MSDSEYTFEGLLEENRKLKQHIEKMKIQTDVSVVGQKQQQPIQGMLKLLENKNKQIHENVAKLSEANEQLRKSYEQTIEYYKKTITALASAMEAKDPYFQFHSSNVDSICRKTGKALSLDKKSMDLLSTAALIHDFGNIGIRYDTIHKPGPLNEEEYNHIKTHPLIASIILEPIGDLDIVIKGIKHHHENFDGTGYPEGLSGENIPLISRIIYIAESFDAITSERPYRKPMSKDNAFQEIMANSNTRYDPAIVKVFLKIQV